MLRVRASGTLGDLSDDKPKNKKQPEWPEKSCAYCPRLWRPLSGMASKIRNHCYDPTCEHAHEMERNAVRRQRYYIMKVRTT